MTIINPTRPQPPSISDPPRGEARLNTLGTEQDDASRGSDGEPTEGIDWMKRARDAYQFSTSYVDSNYRAGWDNSLRAFNGQHASDSKYNSPTYAKRSQIFRPKTRSIVRKNEAAAAAAFFSNLDRTSITAENENDPKSRASADVMGALVQYRLTKSIPWFQFLIGGLQDAQVQSAAVAHVHWRFVTKKDESGEVKILEDQPALDLIPVENIRFDAAASWVDPINTSPYVIHLIPMFVCDVKERMERPDPKGRTWKEYDDGVLLSLTRNDTDPTRQARLKGRQDPTQERRSVSDYDIVWVHRHIHRWDGQDWEFYTLASEKMLTDPEPLKSTVFHGKRPYVLGVASLETHKPLPTSFVEMFKNLQDETNEIANQTLDNGKFVLNKRWIVKRGKNVDLASLVRNVPGGITLADNIDDVSAQEYQDISGSAFQMQDRVNQDIDDLTGNFSTGQVDTSRSPNTGYRALTLLQAPANLLTEYMLKTYTETFVQQVLRQLVLLEQHYETDAVVLSLAGDKAQMSRKYGIDAVTDDLLDRELVVTVNVGMGATDPVQKLQRFTYAAMSYAQFARLSPAGISLGEVAKEMFGLSGYGEGKRFFEGQDPDVAALKQQLAAATKQLTLLDTKVKEKTGDQMVKLQVSREQNATKILDTILQWSKEGRAALAQHLIADQQVAEEALPGDKTGQTNGAQAPQAMQPPQ